MADTQTVNGAAYTKVVSEVEQRVTSNDEVAIIAHANHGESDGGGGHYNNARSSKKNISNENH